MCNYRAYCAIPFGSYTAPLHVCWYTDGPTQHYCTLYHYMCAGIQTDRHIITAHCTTTCVLVYRRTDTSLLHTAPLHVCWYTDVPTHHYCTLHHYKSSKHSIWNVPQHAFRHSVIPTSRNSASWAVKLNGCSADGVQMYNVQDSFRSAAFNIIKGDRNDVRLEM
jgi:hypothetical protein